MEDEAWMLWENSSVVAAAAVAAAAVAHPGLGGGGGARIRLFPRNQIMRPAAHDLIS